MGEFLVPSIRSGERTRVEVTEMAILSMDPGRTSAVGRPVDDAAVTRAGR